MNSLTGESMLQITVDQLARTLCASAVLGAPIEAGERVIIPVAEFGLGFGGGEGSGEKREGRPAGGSGAASAGGGGISAVALIIITKGVPGPEGIQVVSLKKKSEIAEVISTIGEAVGPHVERVLEKGSEMMQQRKGGRMSPVPEGGTEIPIGGEGEA
ncbi:spore germination protein GerW family protein [Methanoculleus chikugoensis]|uniref:spore germination protein GerW family protein n=1 Tax=Methanoculleus chikugoensis TaxID=118126 RepID=UPI0021165933|nr:spore germination protein GerW family protein [Methanoculleus chikugoensis]